MASVERLAELEIVVVDVDRRWPARGKALAALKTGPDL